MKKSWLGETTAPDIPAQAKHIVGSRTKDVSDGAHRESYMQSHGR